MTSNAQPTSTNPPPTLLSIPRELRDLIYFFTFANEEVFLSYGEGLRARNSGLLGTCKQLRAEATKPYYRLTTFIVCRLDVAQWLKMLPVAARTFIRDLRIQSARFPYNEESNTALQFVEHNTSGLGVSREAIKAKFWDAKCTPTWAAHMPVGYVPRDGPYDEGSEDE